MNVVIISAIFFGAFVFSACEEPAPGAARKTGQRTYTVNALQGTVVSAIILYDFQVRKGVAVVASKTKSTNRQFTFAAGATSAGTFTISAAVYKAGANRGDEPIKVGAASVRISDTTTTLYWSNI